MPAPPLTLDDILAWCDLHKQRRGKYPVYTAGPVVDGPLGLNWRKIDNALRLGLRGLEGGSSLARLLAEHRGYRNVQALSPLTEEQIAQWARAHMDRCGGNWPNEESGDIPEAPGETWNNVNAALRHGHRGLPGNDTLAELLARRLGLRTQVAVPALSVATILAWAGEHNAAKGQWPKRNSGPVQGHPGETWVAVNAALELGTRGLPGSSSLAQILDEHHGVPNKSRLPRLTVPVILRFADTWHGRTGEWPTSLSGAIPEMPGLTWRAVNLALHQGLRGLPGGGSLHLLMRQRRKIPKRRSPKEA
jgi:hypothetical protein